jgi:hypothetical protein
MAAMLTVHDERATGERTHSVRLSFSTEKVTVRELIRERIYQEVQDYNLKESEYFNGLVEPSDAEKTLNGFKLRQRRKIDWEEQFERALDAFQRNGFFILVGDRQAERLDEELVVSGDTDVSFVKLVPLVGG